MRQFTGNLALLLVTLSLGCSNSRLAGDKRILRLSQSQLQVTCRLEEKLRTIAGAKPRVPSEEKEFNDDCVKATTSVVQSTTSVAESEANRKALDVNALSVVQTWQTLSKGKPDPSSKAKVVTAYDQAESIAAFEAARDAKIQAMVDAAQSMYESARTVRRSDAALYRCLSFEPGEALSQAVRFNFSPVTNQCFVDVGALKAQVQGLNDVRKALVDGDKPENAGSDKEEGSDAKQ